MKELTDETKKAIDEVVKVPETWPMPSAIPAPTFITSTPRRSGKTSMFDALLTTPGFHSSKPETWGKAKPTPTPWDDLKLPSPDKFEEEYTTTFTAKEMEMAKKGIDEDRLEPDTDDTMKVLAEQITTALVGAKAKAFMLGEPMHLTVRKKDDSYSKRPHIGGEEFIPVRVYAGKRGTLIYVFKPTEVADYAEMEMGEAQAYEHFSGLKKFMEDMIDRGLSVAVKDAKKAMADEEEQRKNAGNFEKYADLGYGSF